MQVISYTVGNENDFGVTSAAKLVKIAAESGCTVTLDRGGRTVNAKKLYEVMGRCADADDQRTCGKTHRR
jgi:phosphotransferase system HPr-like phosphotransfer protein